MPATPSRYTQGRDAVVAGDSLPKQDLEMPVRHALLDQGYDLQALCRSSDVSYSTASKALNGHYGVTSGEMQQMFQRLLHAWKPGTFEPAKDQDDLVVTDDREAPEVDAQEVKSNE